MHIFVSDSVTSLVNTEHGVAGVAIMATNCSAYITDRSSRNVGKELPFYAA